MRNQNQFKVNHKTIATHIKLLKDIGLLFVTYITQYTFNCKLNHNFEELDKLLIIYRDVADVA